MKVARTVWTYTKTIRLVRDGLVSATAGGIKLENGKVTVPVTKAYKSVGTVEVEFTEVVEIISVKVGTTEYKEDIIKKFENNKKAFTAEDILTTFVDLAEKGTEVTVVVKGANGQSTFTIELDVDSEVTVGLFDTKEVPAAKVDDMAAFINITLEAAKEIYPKLTEENELTYELEDGSKFVAPYDSETFNGFYVKVTKEPITIEQLLNAKVTITK